MRRSYFFILVLLFANMLSANGEYASQERKSSLALSCEGTKVGKHIRKVRSPFDAVESVKRLEQVLKTKGMSVFAKFNHQANAQAVDMKMSFSQVLVFGNPKVGTLLMQKNPALALDLPLRIAVWENEKGEVYLSYPRIKEVARAYGLEANPIIEKMNNLLDKLVEEFIKL